jgi:hypothetical protein
MIRNVEVLNDEAARVFFHRIDEGATARGVRLEEKLKRVRQIKNGTGP